MFYYNTQLSEPCASTNLARLVPSFVTLSRRSFFIAQKGHINPSSPQKGCLAPLRPLGTWKQNVIQAERVILLVSVLSCWSLSSPNGRKCALIEQWVTSGPPSMLLTGRHSTGNLNRQKNHQVKLQWTKIYLRRILRQKRLRLLWLRAWAFFLFIFFLESWNLLLADSELLQQ